jgi:hypothetical protein
MGNIEPPRYCAECGKAFPWTLSAIEAAREYADILDGISLSEKEEIKAQIEELVRDSPRQQVAMVKFQKIAAKAGKVALEGFGKILVSVASEVVKKAIWPT